MRWDHLRLDAVVEAADSAHTADKTGTDATATPPRSAGGPPTLPLLGPDTHVRTFDTPGFRGMTFYEVRAKSIVNRVPSTSRVPFRWTINPYRGCQHACFYCFARGSHTYLDLDSGEDFNTKVIVKVNAPELLRTTLSSPRWPGEHIAMGTNVDCYQRAEGRYRLMPGIIAALRDAANPFSILTKGTLILRDLDLLGAAAEVTKVGLNVSAGFVDKDLWRSLEPGTPNPQRRLDACAALNAAGLPCGVLMGPIVPFLSDSTSQLAATVRQAAQAGATHITPIVLHLRPGVREWFLGWLREHHPALLPRYRELYARSAYAPRSYQAAILDRVHALARRHGIGAAAPRHSRSTSLRATASRVTAAYPSPSRTAPPTPSPGRQLALL